MEFEYLRKLDRIDGIKEGFDLGHESGVKEGHESGLQEGKLSAFLSLVHDGILPISEAAKRSGLSEKELEEQLKHIQ